jgi:prevent-host-death family protein
MIAPAGGDRTGERIMLWGLTAADRLYRMAGVTEPVRIPTQDARSRFAAVVEDVAFRGKRYVVTSHDRDRAALVSREDLAKLVELEAKSKPAKRRAPE